MKATSDKKALMVQWYKDGMPMYELALKLYTTRATLYRWLKDEGIILTRQGRDGEHKRSSKCGMLAEKMGVSMPTARKYMRVLSDAELEGRITSEDLRKLGFSKVHQQIVLAFLEKEGYVYDEEEMSLEQVGSLEAGLTQALGKRLLGIDEVVELFADPGRFLNES
jgi:hypothetical protein